MGIDQHDYPLGYSEDEARRLAAQAALFEDLTEDMLRRADLHAGMQVLDVGCGVGDVSLLAARMVGSSGVVLGIDRAAPSVQTARLRATAAGATSARFEEAELETFVAAQKFDAIIGRLVLMYLPDPAAVLRRLRHCLRQGGIMAFQEIDISQVSQVPASTLFGNVTGWINVAFRAGGTELDMGSKLLATFLRAGVPRPTMIAAARVESGPQSPAYEYATAILRSLLPLIERSGIATAEQIGIETLADRLRHDAVANDRVTFLPRLVSAWSRLPA